MYTLNMPYRKLCSHASTAFDSSSTSSPGYLIQGPKYHLRLAEGPSARGGDSGMATAAALDPAAS